MTMTKSYERLIDMFIRASEGYRRSRDKYDHSMTEGDADLHKVEMQQATARVNTLYDVAEEVFGKSHKAFADKVHDITKTKPIYMEVTQDEYELPVAVADSASELARMAGVSPEMVRVHTKRPGGRFVRVEADDV